MRELVNGAFTRARAILERNRSTLEASARVLLERETLAEADLRGWFEKVETAAP